MTKTTDGLAVATTVFYSSTDAVAVQSFADGLTVTEGFTMTHCAETYVVLQHKGRSGPLRELYLRRGETAMTYGQFVLKVFGADGDHLYDTRHDGNVLILFAR